MTYKKFIFYTACTMALLGELKIEANFAPEKNIQTTSSLSKLKNMGMNLYNLSPALTAIIGTLFAWGCAGSLRIQIEYINMKFKKNSKKNIGKNINVTNLIFAPIGTIIGTTVMASGLYGLYATFRKTNYELQKLNELEKDHKNRKTKEK